MKAEYALCAGCELDPRHLLARGSKCLPIRVAQRVVDSKAAVRSAAQADGAAFTSVHQPIDGERDADIDKRKPRKGIHKPRSETSKRRGGQHRMNRRDFDEEADFVRASIDELMGMDRLRCAKEALHRLFEF